MRWLGIGVLFMAGACAISSPPQPVEGMPGAYLITRQAATGFNGSGGLRASALVAADAQCHRMNRVTKIVSERQTEPPYVLGNFPRIDLTFTCAPLSG